MTYSIVLVAKPQSINFILIYHRRNYWPRQKAIRQRISLYYTTIDRRKPNLGENMMSSTLWTQWIAQSEFHPDLKIQIILVGYLFWISFYFVYISKTRFNISKIGVWSILEGGSRSDRSSTFFGYNNSLTGISIIASFTTYDQAEGKRKRNWFW